MLAITFGWSFACSGAAGRSGRELRRIARRRRDRLLAGRASPRGLSTNVLLLAGVTLNSFFSALILFVQYFADFAETYRTLRWLMGDLDVSSYSPSSPRCRLLALSFAAFAWLPGR